MGRAATVARVSADVSLAVEVEALTVRYGERLAVDELSFVVPAGQIVALLGPNGAGKTSTVETIEGYRRPDGGRVRVLGLDPVRDRRQLTPRIGVMLQEGGVYTAIRPPEVVRLFARYYDDPLDPEACRAARSSASRSPSPSSAARPWRSSTSRPQGSTSPAAS
jgi:ABC-2 type transport system ATP-binding protein